MTDKTRAHIAKLKMSGINVIVKPAAHSNKYPIETVEIIDINTIDSESTVVIDVKNFDNGSVIISKEYSKNIFEKFMSMNGIHIPVKLNIDSLNFDIQQDKFIMSILAPGSFIEGLDSSSKNSKIYKDFTDNEDSWNGFDDKVYNMWLDKVNYKTNSYTKIADRLKILLNQIYFIEKMAYFKVRNEIREYREKAHPNESFSHEIPGSLDMLTKKLERVMDNMIYFSAKNRDDILQKPYNIEYFSIERDLAELVKNHNNMIDFSKIDYYLSEKSSIPYNAHIKPDCRTIFICPKLRKEFEQQATDIFKRISKL